MDEEYFNLLTEHQMVAGMYKGEHIIQISRFPGETLQDEVDHFYPGAVVDTFGVVTGGWPTDEKLTAHRRVGKSVRKRWWRQ